MLSENDSDILRILATANELLPAIADLEGRQNHAQIGIVSDNQDPTGLRRFSSASEDKGGRFRGDFEMRALPFPFFDPPVARPGMSSVAQAFGGNPHDRFTGGVLVNDQNPPFEKDDPLNDCWWLIPGNNTHQIQGDNLVQIDENCIVEIGENRDTEIGGEENRRVEEDYSLSDGKNLTIENDAGVIFKQFEDGSFFVKNNTGAGVFFSKEGVALLRDAFNNQITLGGTGTVSSEGKLQADTVNPDLACCDLRSDLVLKMNGNDIIVQNAGDVTLNGKTATTVGAIDDDGDRTIGSGWN
jgi:hypothetical protein